MRKSLQMNPRPTKVCPQLVNATAQKNLDRRSESNPILDLPAPH